MASVEVSAVASVEVSADSEEVPSEVAEPAEGGNLISYNPTPAVCCCDPRLPCGRHPLAGGGMSHTQTAGVGLSQISDYPG